MIWNFRVVRHVDEGEEWFGIHEAYYNDDETGGIQDDRTVSLTVDPVPLCANSLEELRERMEGALNKPVLEYDQL